MRHLKRLLVGVLALVVTTGCAATVKIGGIVVVKEAWDRAEMEIRSRASFELRCAPEQLSLRILSTMQFLEGAGPSSIGVSGCDRQATYVRVVNAHRETWLLEGTSDRAPLQR